MAYYGTGRAVSTCTTTHVEVTYGGVAVAPMARGTGHRADTALRTVVPGMARTTKNIVGKKKSTEKNSVSMDLEVGRSWKQDNSSGR